MADAPTGGPTAAPGTPAPAPVEGAPAAPPLADASAEVKMTSAALKARLDEERAAGRKALLKEYGLDKQDDLKARFDRLKALEDEKLTSEQRTQKALEEATAKAAAGEAHSVTAQAAVDALFATLTDVQKAAIEEQKPASAAERLKLITFARALGGAQPPPTTTQSAPPAPTTTSPAPRPPPPANQQTAYQKWEALAAKPLAQAAFYKANGAAIESSRPT